MINLELVLGSFWQLARHWKMGDTAKLELTCEGGNLQMNFSAKLGHPDLQHFQQEKSPPSSTSPFVTSPSLPCKRKTPSQLRRQDRRRRAALDKAAVKAATDMTAADKVATDKVTAEKVLPVAEEAAADDIAEQAVAEKAVDDDTKKLPNEKVVCGTAANAAARITIKAASKALGSKTPHSELRVEALRQANTEEERQAIEYLFSFSDQKMLAKVARPKSATDKARPGP